jgi:hypothetical protein
VVKFLPTLGIARMVSDPFERAEMVNNPAADVTDCLIKALRFGFGFFIVTGPLR